MKKGGKILTEKDVRDIEIMLGKNLAVKTIAEIKDCSQTTVKRVQNKEHYLQRQIKVKEDVQEPKQEKEELPKQTRDYFEFRVDEKLDKIIELLQKLESKEE